MRILVIILNLLLIQNIAAQPQVQSCIEKALDTWTILDTARAISQEDRRYFYRDLVKANLDLYANVYWLSQYNQAISGEAREEVDKLLTALSISQQDIFGTPKTPEEASLGMILQETVGMWDTVNSTRTDGIQGNRQALMARNNVCRP